MMVREPAVAGRFYPLGREACLREIKAMHPAAPPADLPERPVGGIVPHAGWMFSGATALAALRAIESRRRPRTFVIFGASHSPRVRRNSIFASGAWQSPLGDVAVDERLAAEILARAPDLLTDDPAAHEDEHSIEVQVPLVQHVFPEAKIVPILVLREGQAVALGQTVGQTIALTGADAVCLGSTDLTHYGPMYGFTPQGMGAAAIRWVRDQNDRRMIELMLRLDAEAVATEARTNMNACGPGAVAATLAAARELGAVRGCLVHYTTSYDVCRDLGSGGGLDAAVGYAGVVF